MRKQFAKLLFQEMAINEDVYVITGDLGYGLWDKIKDTYPTRFFNVGSSEMAMMGMAMGYRMKGLRATILMRTRILAAESRRWWGVSFGSRLWIISTITMWI